MLSQLTTKLERFRAVLAALGPVETVRYVWHSRLRRRTGTVYALHPRGARHPVWIRSDSSDRDVFHDIFIAGEYAGLAGLTDVRLVLDCGANVGYTAAYFLSRFPHCHVVAVEPDPGNCALLTRNLATYGDRASVLRAAIWSHPARLTLAPDRYRDGRDWARQVRLAAPDEPVDFDGVDIGSLLAASGHDRISLLKMDVEGAEAVIFAGNTQWLDQVDAIAIELHDDSMFGRGSEIFFAAMRGQGFRIMRSGGITLCRRIAGPAA
jgi:FkbM family methyltransferase